MSQLELFEYGTPTDKPRRKTWGGNKSRKARAAIRAMLPMPCWRCGGIITPDDPESSWQAGHIEDRAFTEANGLPDAETTAEHTQCNLSAGGKRGAAITNQKYQQPATPITYRDHEPQWW